MTVNKTIKITRSDVCDQSITVSSGTDTFTITFCEVPRVSDNAERRFQRVRKPLADVNEIKRDSPGPYLPFTIYGPQTEDSTKGVKKGSGSHFLAIKDDKAFAIRMVGDSKESAFKVKVRVGGVNVLQHTTHGKKSQDYFVVSEQKWIWGKQVDKNTARQFRVFRRGRERLSLRYQLQKNNIKKEVEIEITSRRLARPWPPPRMTLGDVDELIPQLASPLPPQPAYQAPTCHDSTSSAPYSDAMPTLQTDFQGPTSSDTGPMSPNYTMIPVPHVEVPVMRYQRRSRPLRPCQPSPSCLPSCLPPCLLAPPEPVIHSLSPPLSPPPESAPPKTPNDQESIHSDPEEDMLPHQMVVGTGGLIEQIVHPDKHPEWIDDCTVTLKFKIVDPEYLKKEAGVKTLGIPGGNYREVPNPPDGTFRGHAPVVTDPDGLRRDIRSPMEMEIELNRDAGRDGRDGEPPESPKRESLVDSGVGLVGEEGEEEDVTEFQRLEKEAKSQPRGLMNDLRMKKESRKQRKRGGVRIQMVVNREEPKGERKSRWRTFVDAMRRILTLGR